MVSPIGAHADHHGTIPIGAGCWVPEHESVMAPKKPRLGPERRGALGILADAPRGLTEALMLAHGITAETIESLVRDGLATSQPESTRAGGRTNRVKITDTGLQALES
jgi:hypothetical protein